MRVNNRRAKNIILSVYFILIVLAILSVTMLSAYSDLTSNPTLASLIVVFVFVVLFFLVYSISKYFEYDSEGLKVVLVNRGLMLSDKFNYRENQLEFYKQDLISYKLKNYIVYQGLMIKCKDKSGKIIQQTFNVTLLSSKKQKYIRQSLHKMVNLNKK